MYVHIALHSYLSSVFVKFEYNCKLKFHMHVFCFYCFQFFLIHQTLITDGRVLLKVGL